MKVAAFIVAFTLNVQVHASEIQLPAGCLTDAKAVCAVENPNEQGFEVKVGESTVVLDHASSLVRTSEHEIRLVKGTAWVKATGLVTVQSEFGAVANVGSGDFWVTKTKSQITALAVSTDVNLRPKGSQETLLVSQGLQNTLGQVTFGGVAETGIPMPIPFKEHLFRWARLYRGDKKEFETQVDKFHETWTDASRASAQINQQLFERKVASVDELAKAEEAKRSKVQSEQNQLRQMFRKRMLQGL